MLNSRFALDHRYLIVVCIATRRTTKVLGSWLSLISLVRMHVDREDVDEVSRVRFVITPRCCKYSQASARIITSPSFRIWQTLCHGLSSAMLKADVHRFQIPCTIMVSVPLVTELLPIRRADCVFARNLRNTALDVDVKMVLMEL